MPHTTLFKMLNMEVKARILVICLTAFLLTPILNGFTSQAPRIRYECRICGSGTQLARQGILTGSNSDDLIWSQEPIKLEGREKEEAVKRALNSKEFQLVASILSKIGYQPTLEGSAAMKAAKIVEGKPIDYLVAGIRFTGDLRSRFVLVVVFVEPYQEATAYRADEDYRILEVLVRAEKGRITGGKLAPITQGNRVINRESSTGIPPPPCSPPCGTCQFCFQECVAYDIPGIIHCCTFCTNCLALFPDMVAVMTCALLCVSLYCPSCFYINCIDWNAYCRDCTPETGYLPECMGCG